MATFTFNLEPELKRRRDQREELERRVAAARENRADAARRHDEADRARRRVGQRIARARDDLSRPPPAGSRGFADGASWLRGLDRAAEAAERTLTARAADVRSAEHRLRALIAELDEAHARVTALERLREERERAWRRAREAVLERRRDEDAILAWSRRRVEDRS